MNYRESLRRLFLALTPGPREADLDGELHVDGTCCRYAEQHCRRCGSRLHSQGMYHGMLYSCSNCDPEWQPHGTYRSVVWKWGIEEVLW